MEKGIYNAGNFYSISINNTIPMKFVTVEPAGDKGHTRYHMALGKNEMAILIAMLENSLRYTPRTFRTQNTIARMRNMSKAMKAVLPYMSEIALEELKDL